MLQEYTFLQSMQLLYHNCVFDRDYILLSKVSIQARTIATRQRQKDALETGRPTNNFSIVQMPFECSISP